jgi:two-component system NtrC family sensor kinase
VSAKAVDDVEVLIDAARMQRAIANIGANAAEAMGATPGSFTVNAEKSGTMVRIALQDNGPGIAEEIRDRLFDPFVTRGKAHGTGLGLAITRQIVEAHGGSISVDPGNGPGARFIIELPVANADAKDGNTAL